MGGQPCRRVRAGAPCRSSPAQASVSRLKPCGVKAALVKAGVKLKGDNVFAVETVAGARVLALPGDESTGLSVDGVIIADEAARLSPEMISALRPMRARASPTPPGS